MANAAVVLGAIGAAILGALGLRQAIMRQQGREGEGDALLSGDFGIAALGRVAPGAIVFGVNSRAQVTVAFNGSVVNTGNAPFIGIVDLIIYAGGFTGTPVGSASGQVSVPPGSTLQISRSDVVLESDPPGDVVAEALLVNNLGVTIGRRASVVLATIQSGAIVNLGGEFGLS